MDRAMKILKLAEEKYNQENHSASIELLRITRPTADEVDNNSMPAPNNVEIDDNTPFWSLQDMIDNADIIVEDSQWSTISADVQVDQSIEAKEKGVIHAATAEEAAEEDNVSAEKHTDQAADTQEEVDDPVAIEEVVEVNSTQLTEHKENQPLVMEPGGLVEVEEGQEEGVEGEGRRNKRNDSRRLVRKKVSKPEEWKSNTRKRHCQSGKEYVNVRGKKVDAKKITNKKDCLNMCKLRCSRKISENSRKTLFNYYYGLNQNEKYVFLRQNTEKYLKSRKTVEQPSRRKYSFKYYFKVQEEKLQVCKQFFLGTLNISQKPIYTVHTVDHQTPKKDLRGKTGTQKITDERKQVVMDHIKKFDVTESHYCREHSKRKYLEATLTIPKMYDLHLKYCADNNITNPVKVSMYRRIFSTKFNYGFHRPKKDVCEKCFNYHLKKKEKRLNETEQEEMERHVAEKEAMRKEKDNDKKSDIPILCFDLENVITCPRSFVGNHFYLPKLTMYNLTGHLSTTKTAYCVLWIETLQGRSGNCLASAFRKIVERVLNDNHLEQLIRWSDSCVPQNRNSHIAFCVLDILRNYPDLKSVTMKYSVPGHGAVQEVDNIHSQIERHMSQKEFFSPLSLIKELKQVNKKNPFVIMQMTKQDFKNYEGCSKQLKYDSVPFTKVYSLKFSNNDLTEVSFKTSHLDQNFNKVSINPPVPILRHRRSSKSKQSKTQPEIANLVPKVLPDNKDISKEKIEALKKMKTCMPQVDQDFYKAFLNL